MILLQQRRDTHAHVGAVGQLEVEVSVPHVRVTLEHLEKLAWS